LTAIGAVNLPRLSEISLDDRSIAFTLILSLLSGLFFGSIPVLRYVPSRQLLTSLGAMRTASASTERQHGSNLLVAAQVAMALVLLISAVLMIRTFQAMRNVDPGFSDPASLQIMRLSIPETLVRDSTRALRMQNSILDKLAAIPGVSSTGFAASVPMSGTEPSWDEIFVEGKISEGDNPPMRLFNYVSPGYFHSAGTRFVAARDFTWAEIYSVRPIGIVSEGLARELWGSPRAAIGKHFREFESGPWHEVVGVVQDVRENGVDQVSPATVYWPSLMGDAATPEKLEAWRTPYFAIRANRAGTQAFINEMQQAVWSVNSNLPVAEISTMQDIYSDSMARTSFTLVMLAIAGVMALALGILGIYGVISYAVSQRIREIGIRMALGANQRELIWMFVRSFRVAADSRWHLSRPVRGSRTCAPHANPIVWHSPARSGHVHGRTSCSGRSSGGGILSARAPQHCCRSGRSTPSRLTILPFLEEGDSYRTQRVPRWVPAAGPIRAGLTSQPIRASPALGSLTNLVFQSKNAGGLPCKDSPAQCIRSLNPP
jgi:predicted permease